MLPVVSYGSIIITLSQPLSKYFIIWLFAVHSVSILVMHFRHFPEQNKDWYWPEEQIYSLNQVFGKSEQHYQKYLQISNDLKKNPSSRTLTQGFYSWEVKLQYTETGNAHLALFPSSFPHTACRVVSSPLCGSLPLKAASWWLHPGESPHHWSWGFQQWQSRGERTQQGRPGVMGKAPVVRENLAPSQADQPVVA